MPIALRRNSHILCASSAVLGTLLLAAFSASTSLRAAEHTLMPSPQTVHIGYFLATVKPVLSINSGDIVTIETAAAIVPMWWTSPAWFRPAPCRSTSATSTAT